MGKGPEHIERTVLADVGQGQGAHSQGLGGAIYIHQSHLDSTNMLQLSRKKFEGTEFQSILYCIVIS